MGKCITWSQQSSDLPQAFAFLPLRVLVIFSLRNRKTHLLISNFIILHWFTHTHNLPNFLPSKHNLFPRISSEKVWHWNENDRGEPLIDSYAENNFYIMNSHFKDHIRRLYTWSSPDGPTRNKINYILISNQLRPSINNVKTYPRYDCGNDHNNAPMHNSRTIYYYILPQISPYQSGFVTRRSTWYQLINVRWFKSYINSM